jgi:hypothetical protein
MVNLTPHPVTILTPDGPITIEPSGQVTRIRPIFSGYVQLGGMMVPVVSRRLGGVEGLPFDDHQCIVSAQCLTALQGRRGVYAPDTNEGGCVRDRGGRIVAVRRLVEA